MCVVQQCQLTQVSNYVRSPGLSDKLTSSSHVSRIAWLDDLGTKLSISLFMEAHIVAFLSRRTLAPRSSALNSSSISANGSTSSASSSPSQDLLDRLVSWSECDTAEPISVNEVQQATDTSRELTESGLLVEDIGIVLILFLGVFVQFELRVRRLATRTK